jgi:hypothetical protein
VEHKDQKQAGRGHERRSSLRLSDLHRMVEDAVPAPAPENGETKHPGKHTGHAHAAHGHHGHEQKKK